MARRKSGFTIIEFMIVVAIGSILITIAIPNWIGFYGKSQQAEAKSNLGSVFKAEKAFIADKDTYADSLAALSWVPEGELRYIIGFTSDGAPAASGVNDTAELASVTALSTRYMIGPGGVPLTEVDLPTAPVSQSRFTIGAAGNIDGDGTLDQWTLNDANEMVAVVNDIDN